jgi:hypothetical protein
MSADLTAVEIRPPSYVVCSVCGKTVSLRVNGTLRHHTFPRIGHEQFPPRCPESGQTP